MPSADQTTSDPTDQLNIGNCNVRTVFDRHQNGTKNKADLPKTTWRRTEEKEGESWISVAPAVRCILQCPTYFFFLIYFILPQTNNITKY